MHIWQGYRRFLRAFLIQSLFYQNFNIPDGYSRHQFFLLTNSVCLNEAKNGHANEWRLAIDGRFNFLIYFAKNLQDSMHTSMTITGVGLI